MSHVIGRGRNARETYPQSPSAGGGGTTGVSSSVLWDSTQPSLGNRVRTWAEVMAAVNASQAPIRIYNEKVNLVPAGAYDMRFAMLSGLTSVDATSVVELADGAMLSNLAGVEDGVELIATSNTQASIVVNPSPSGGNRGISVESGAALVNIGTHAMIDVPTGDIVTITFSLNGGTASLPGPIVHLNGTAKLFVLVQAFVGPVQFSDGWVTGDAPATLFYEGDYTIITPLPVNVGFLGTQEFLCLSGISGTTAQRPNATFLGVNLRGGLNYFDTTLGIPIWWSGVTWVNSAGAPV